MKGIQKGYKGIDVEIISYTKHPAKIIWDMLKQTWISLHDKEYGCLWQCPQKTYMDTLFRYL